MSFELEAEEQTGEQEFFKFLFLSAMLNIPQWMLDCVQDLNHYELYMKAKYDNQLHFHQFAEFLDQEILGHLYKRDN